jgi:hypothetical protein
MRFASIVPTDCLDDGAFQGSDCHLVLAQQASRDARYFEFYRKRARLGDTVILDNGAYEGQLVTFEELLRLTRELKPTVLVMPDKLGDYEETKRMEQQFLPMAMRASYVPQLMPVLQSSDTADVWQWIRTYREHTFYKWIAFPRCMGEQRTILASGLKYAALWDSTCKYWALGMLDGDIEELSELSHLGFYGCDSSAPVWRGLQGFSLNEADRTAWQVQGTPVDFSTKLDTIPFKHLELAKSNLAEVLAECRE